MKSMLSICFALSVCFSASAYSADAEKTTLPTGAPLAEMLLYEAAEQAVEDGYARIIPDSEVENKGKGDQATPAGQNNSEANHQETQPTPTLP